MGEIMSVKLLERKNQQIESDLANHRIARSLMGWVVAIKGVFDQSIWHRSEPKFYEYANGTDYWWYTFDPQTGRCIYADSVAELQLRTKENYPGE
jgi:hypothetical protein